MNKEKESLFKKALKILIPSLFAIAVMVAGFGCFSMVTNAVEFGHYYITYDLSWQNQTYTIYFDTVADLVMVRGPEKQEAGRPAGSTAMGTSYQILYTNLNGQTTISTPPYFSCSHTADYFTNKDNIYSVYLPANEEQYTWRTVNLVSTNIPLFETLEDARNFASTGDDSGQLNKFTPDWDSATKNNTVGLNSFNAIYKDGVITTTWNGLSSRVVDISAYENTYVRAVAGFCDKETGVITDAEIDIFSISDNGFIYEVPQELLDYTYVRYVKCTPYYYQNDDINATLYKGIDSIYYWDIAGNVSSSDAPTSDIIGVYDSEIGYLKLTISGLSASDCHGGDISWMNCFSLSWDIPTYDRKKYEEYCEFKFDFKYSYSTNWTTSLKYGSAFIDYSENGEKLCINVKNGTHNFCAETFSEIIDIQSSFENYFETLSNFNINPLNKIYVRIVRKDIVTGDVSYGDWAVYNVDKSTGLLTFNKEEFGDMNVYEGDTEIDADGTIYDEPIQSVSGNNGSDADGSFFDGIDLTDVANIGKYFITLVESLMNFLGDFPALFSRIFSFLPNELLAMIYMSIVIVVIIGLFKIFL